MRRLLLAIAFAIGATGIALAATTLPQQLPNGGTQTVWQNVNNLGGPTAADNTVGGTTAWTFPFGINAGGGLFVVAPTSATPSPQPGNPYLNNYLMGDGIANGLWELCYNCNTGIGAGGYSQGHYHVLWVTNPGDATAPADIALGGCALCAGDNSTTGQNVALGVGTLENKTDHTPITGYSNIAIGNIALGYLTSGHGNVAIGIGGGECISTGIGNVILSDGMSAAAGGCSGSYNFFAGPEAGFNAQTSTADVRIGQNAGQNMTGGTNNVLLGFDAAQNASNSLSSAVFIGPQAGQAATGSAAVGVGLAAAQNVTGTDAVAIGDGALQGAAGANGQRTVAIGASAGLATTTGTQNVWAGFQSGVAATTASLNTCLGTQSCFNLTTGGNNVAIGNSSCGGLVSGTWNVCIGNNATLPNTTANGQLSIANAIYGLGNNLNGTGISTGCIAFYTTACNNGTVNFAVPVVVPAGACTGGVQVGNVNIYSSSGAPVCTAPNGSLYMRSDGTTGARMYVSAGGGTWAAVAGV